MFVLAVVLGIVGVAAIVVALITRSRLAAQRRLTSEAEQRAAAAEQERAETAGTLDEVRRERDAAEARAVGVDADVLWALELLRSERTWRHSVAPGPDAPPVLGDTAELLRQALQIELDAAREEVGAEVELDADLPAGVTAAGSLLALRVAQELLAPAVRDGELTTLQLRADGADVVVAVQSLDQDDEPLALPPLAIPASSDVETTADGVRVRRAIRVE
jgi:hypothetical protein